MEDRSTEVLVYSYSKNEEEFTRTVALLTGTYLKTKFRQCCKTRATKNIKGTKTMHHKLFEKN